MRVVCLAGGVGGAKLADGLQQTLAPGDLDVVVNTGDDFERHGLLVCPDHDTVMYTLGGVADEVQGWGMAGETWRVMEHLRSLGEETWFALGDRDLATHLFRTGRLRAGARPTGVALALQAALDVPSRILPMTDSTVRTQVRTDDARFAGAAADGWLDFQDYFVRLHQEPPVREVRFLGAAAAAPTPEVLEAFARAELVVVAPSNPIVSVGPILAVPGMLDALASARRRGTPVVAVSGIVGGRALKGPADRMLADLGEEASALGVARRYRSFADEFVLDVADAALAPAVEALGIRPIVLETVMSDVPSRGRLARQILDAVPTGTGR